MDSPKMSKVKKDVLGKTQKKTTEVGPHLKQGSGTSFEQAKLTKGFLLQDSRPGHSQKKNTK